MGTFRHRRTAVIGAGPFGLAVAAELRRAGVDHVLFGRPLAFWKDWVPAGLNLLSDPLACSLSKDQFTVEDWEKHRGKISSRPFRGEEFIDYCLWFAGNACIPPDPRPVERIARASSGGYTLRLSDGEQADFDSVVIAIGLKDFAFRPNEFSALPSSLCSHVTDLKDLTPFQGKKIAVIGGGQSALEYAALLQESGADVEVIAREPAPHWYPYGGHLRPTTGENGGVKKPHPGLRGLLNHPDVFPRVPAAARAWWLARSLRPAVDDHLQKRLENVKLTFGRRIVSNGADGITVMIKLDDGSERKVDHLVLGTGYHIDVETISFLDPTLRQQIRRYRGYPRLNCSMESTAPGIYFAGAPAAMTFGTDMWFVHGSPMTGRRISRSIATRDGR
jgi:thioredoxin reductase